MIIWSLQEEIRIEIAKLLHSGESFIFDDKKRHFPQLKKLLQFKISLVEIIYINIKQFM
jgi:hypothetical protein